MGYVYTFSVVFITPITATFFFVIEFIKVGTIYHFTIFPVILALVIIYKISNLLNIQKLYIEFEKLKNIDFLFIIKIILLSILCALISIFFL